MALTLEMIKGHLRVEEDYTAEDALIEAYHAAAMDAVASMLCISVEQLQESITPKLEQAVLLLIGEWFEHRGQTSAVNVKEIPDGVRLLVSLSRDYSK